MSDSVYEFLVSRRRGVLLGAIDDLMRCDRAGLLPTAHRLRGTLGTFGLSEAEHVIIDLERSLRCDQTDAAADTISQQAAIDGLRSCLDTIASPASA